MLKSGLRLLFGTFTQLIFVIVSYEFFHRYAASNGGIGTLNAMDTVNPLIWNVISIELILSICLIVYGLKNKSND